MKTAVALPASEEPVVPVVLRRSSGEIFGDLVKARLTFMVLVTTLVGFYLGLGSSAVNYRTLLACMFGTALCAAGSAALNQLWERRADALMHRTRNRPLPSGELQPVQAAGIGISLCVGGLALLAVLVNPLCVLTALATIVSYLFLYTPLKKISSLNTLVGAIPGALPPVIGYTAASGRMDGVVLILFTILFFWQLPHFLAISWLYREDYLRGGFVMISGRDATGGEVAWKAFAYTLLLIAATLLPYWLVINNVIYLTGSLLLGGGFLFCAWRFVQSRDNATARKLFFASIIYLPVLLGLLVFTRK